jgi:hypothetical protein
LEKVENLIAAYPRKFMPNPTRVFIEMRKTFDRKLLPGFLRHRMKKRKGNGNATKD